MLLPLWKCCVLCWKSASQVSYGPWSHRGTVSACRSFDFPSKTAVDHETALNRPKQALIRWTILGVFVFDSACDFFVHTYCNLVEYMYILFFRYMRMQIHIYIISSTYIMICYVYHTCLCMPPTQVTIGQENTCESWVHRVHAWWLEKTWLSTIWVQREEHQWSTVLFAMATTTYKRGMFMDFPHRVGLPECIWDSRQRK